MSTDTQGVSFDFFLDQDGGDTQAVETATKEEASSPPDSKAQEYATGTNVEAAANEIAEMMGMVPEEADEKTDEGEKKTDTEAEAKEEAKVKQPITHDPRLLYAASAWGIDADEAASYPTEEALIATIRERERRYKLASATRESEDKALAEINKVDDNLVPDIDPDKIDIDDPAEMRETIKKLHQAAVKINDARIKDREKFEQENSKRDKERQQAEDKAYRDLSSKIVGVVDEEVASWGDEFKELIGTPSESIRTPGKQGDAARKLNEHVEMLQLGYRQKHGLPSPDEAVRLTREFVKMAQHALWPEVKTKQARREVSEGLKRNKGGAALRSGVSRSASVPDQGDDAAKAAIGDYLSSVGLDMWSRK
jgi:hypothetical protein